MENKELAKQIEQRTKNFAISVINLSITLPGIPEGKVIKNQLTKSGTSIGANYREANRARSKADFLNKIKICESEASETLYWLEIIKEFKWTKDIQVDKVKKECTEVLAIFTSIAQKLKL